MHININQVPHLRNVRKKTDLKKQAPIQSNAPAYNSVNSDPNFDVNPSTSRAEWDGYSEGEKDQPYIVTLSALPGLM